MIAIVRIPIVTKPFLPATESYKYSSISLLLLLVLRSNNDNDNNNNNNNDNNNNNNDDDNDNLFCSSISHISNRFRITCNHNNF